MKRAGGRGMVLIAATVLALVGLLPAGAWAGSTGDGWWSVTFTNAHGTWNETWGAGSNEQTGAQTARPEASGAAESGQAAVSRAERPVLVALGDSVAAGAGLPVVDDGGFGPACARSGEAYVNRVAEATGMRAVNLACSGATVWNGVITDQDTNAGEVPAQLTQMRQGPDPAAAVLTVGANDVRWTVFLRECAQGDCADEAHTNAFQTFLRSANVGVRTALTSMHVFGADRVFVTGYYDPFAGNVVTPEQFGFSAEEVDWYRARLAELNQMLQRAAADRPYATFVPVDFGGAGEQLVQSPDDPAPFHPTAAGQAVMAQAVTAAIQQR